MSGMIESGSNKLCETDGELLEAKAESNSEFWCWVRVQKSGYGTHDLMHRLAVDN